MSTEQQRQAWRELDAARTPGEWEVMPFVKGNGIVVDLGNGDGRMRVVDVLENATQADAAFIAAASTAVPALLADVERLTGERDALYADVDRAATMLGDEVLAHGRTRRERDALAAELATVREAANVEWQAEHAARLVAEERLKAATGRADALRLEIDCIA